MALNIPKRVAPADGEPAASAAASRIIHRPAAVSGPAKVGAPKSGFILASPTTNPFHRRAIIDLAGEEGTGKTHFGFTAPGPIYEHSFDIGNEGVIEKFWGNKAIHVAEYELSVQPGEGTAQEVADAADKVWNQFVANFRDGLSSCGNGTTLIDTGSEMWELLRLSRFGRLTQVMPHMYTSVNKEMQGLVRESFNYNGSTIFLTKMKPEWENYIGPDGKEKGRKTGRFERTGFKDMPFQVQIVAEANREDKAGGGSEFSITIHKCRLNPDLHGITITNDFDTLMELVFAEQ